MTKTPRYVVIDTETSGLPLRAARGEPPISADAPGQPRMAAFAAIVATPDLEIDEEASYSTFIRPDGWEMSEGAVAVNGLTIERLRAEGRPVSEPLAVYSEFVNLGFIVVCHNAIFDLKVMRGELRRAGMPDLFDKTRNVCTMADFLDVFKLPPSHKQLAAGRAMFKQPKLVEAYRHFYGRDFEDAHTADADARATLAVFRKLVGLGLPIEPKIRYSAHRKPA